MGELFTGATKGVLYYVEKPEFDRALRLNLSPSDRVTLFATLARINALYMIARAGSGHIGSSFSSLDIVSQLYLETMQGDDVYFSSKGHDAPGLYSALIGLGQLPFDKIHTLRKAGGLPGHPDVHTDGMVTNTGSLGMGISKAKGMILADRLRGRRRRIYVMTGDGELQEGQFWESLASAANIGLHELTVIVDHNKLQSDTFVADVSDLGDLSAKLDAFGWRVERCDGHDAVALQTILTDLQQEQKRPQIVIADTVKGRGVSFMEHTSMPAGETLYRYHSGAPSADDYVAALEELAGKTNALLEAAGGEKLALEPTTAEAGPAPTTPPKRMIPAYTDALLEVAAADDSIVALDADLVLDTGLIPFRERFPNRFFECGIAEQDMVSQAGGMATAGLLPIVHSFACFLTPRANEQIYNNATERRKVIYVGSLAGVLPGGPGHSHQSVRDIALMGSVAGMTCLEASCPEEIGPLMRWAAQEATGPVYMRLCSIPCEIPYTAETAAAPAPGRGHILRPGTDVAFVSHGPVMLPQAWAAAERLAADGLSAAVVNLPWLNTVDGDWLMETVGSMRLVIAVDDNYERGGQADRIAAAVAESTARTKPAVVRRALDSVPICGTNAEVLAHHQFDAEHLAELAKQSL